MKWLLVTTNPRPFEPGTDHPHGAGWNIGDQFARLGTEELIREVDPDAAFAYVNMDSRESITTPQEFDRAVFAGRPMFFHKAPNHPLWTELLDGWLCREPRKVMALGVGDCFPLEATWNDEHAVQIERARLRLHTLHTRAELRNNSVLHIGGNVFGGICPAAWLLLGRPQAAEAESLSLANFMIDGCHYPALSKYGSAFWRAAQSHFARLLQDHGFQFVAHTREEMFLAHALGWHSAQVHCFDTLEEYLTLYARAQRFIGNRVHGGLVLAPRMAWVSVFGNDTRLHAVRDVGHHAATLEQASIGMLRACTRTVQTHPSAAFEERRRKVISHRTLAKNLLKIFVQ